MISILLLFSLFLPFTWAACNCNAPTLASSFQNSSIVIKALVTGKEPASNGVRAYDARVVTVYKGCNVKPKQSVVLVTNISADSCGVFLTVSTEYVFMGNVDHVAEVVSTSGVRQIVYISISKCQFRGRYKALNSFQINHLKQLQSKVPPCKGPTPFICNATSCGKANLPNIPLCPGYNSILNRVKCTFLNSTRKCGYVILPCPAPPPVKCNATSCGIEFLPNIRPCPGQTDIANRVKCTYLNSTKKCGYEILPCPVVNCTFSDCGPVPPLARCPDGVGPFISCDFNQEAAQCAWNITPCKFL